MERSPSSHLHVSFRRVRTEDAGDERVLAVFCARQARAVALSECRHCAHCQGLCVDPSDRQTFLRCTADASDGPDEADAGGTPQRAAAGEQAAGAAQSTTLAEIMTASVRTISPDAGIDELTRIFLEESISAMPVVNASGKAIGLVSKTDVLQRYFEHRRTAADGELEVTVEHGSTDQDDPVLELPLAAPADATVRDIMTHLVFSLGEEAPVSRAAALMAYEGIHRIVVSSAAGEATGIVSSLDILRWLARRDGYVVPGQTQRQSNPPDALQEGDSKGAQDAL